MPGDMHFRFRGAKIIINREHNVDSSSIYQEYVREKVFSISNSQ